MFCPKCGDQSKKKTPKFKGIILVTSVLCLIIIALIVLLFIQNNEKNITKSVEKEVTPKKDTVDDVEYIFPDSNTEYLTETDVENLSVDELALARNEIIARHGRIFTDEKYKVYFESKSWYKGTIEANEFDIKYEQILNDIEKKNIGLIKKYEIIPNDSAEEYYASILSEYQQAQRNDFEDANSQYPNINPDFLNADGGTLYYTTLDLCNDGVPELFISQNFDKNKSSYNIVDIYGYTGKTPQHLVVAMGTGTKPLDENKTMGNRTHYTVCDNNMIKKIENSNEVKNSTRFYQLDKNSITLQQIEGTMQDGTSYYRLFSGGLEAEEISLQQYSEITEQYPPKENIVWYKVADFKCDTGKIPKSESTYSLANEYYGDFLKFYKEEEQNGFNRKDLELINPIFSDLRYFPNGYAQSGIELYYTVIDLANDGVPELFISDGDTLYGAYGFYESEFQVCPLLNTIGAYMGDRSRYFICDNNLIKHEGSSGASSNIVAYYQVDSHSYTANCKEAVYQEGDNYYFGILDDNDFLQSSTATADDYEALNNKYPLKNDIEWLKLSEF